MFVLKKEEETLNKPLNHKKQWILFVHLFSWIQMLNEHKCLCMYYPPLPVAISWLHLLDELKKTAKQSL